MYICHVISRLAVPESRLEADLLGYAFGLLIETVAETAHDPENLDFSVRSEFYLERDLTLDSELSCFFRVLRMGFEDDFRRHDRRLLSRFCGLRSIAANPGIAKAPSSDCSATVADPARCSSCDSIGKASGRHGSAAGSPRDAIGYPRVEASALNNPSMGRSCTLA